MSTPYINFKNQLAIIRTLSYEQQLVTLYENKYFKLITQRISRNYNIDTDALRSEGAIAWIQSTWFCRYVIDEHIRFSRSVFEFTIKQAARNIKKAEQSSFDDIDTTNISTEDPADLLITQHDQLVQERLLPQFKEDILTELSALREKITGRVIDIKEYANLMGINIATVMEKTGIKSRYQIIWHPELFRNELLSLFDEFMQLWHKWFMNEYVYIEQLKLNFGSFRVVYEQFAPSSSYRNFMLWLESPTYWDMKQLYAKFGDINV